MNSSGAFAIKDGVETCYDDAFKKIMMNSHQQFLLPIKVRARQRIHSEPLDPEEDVTKKRKNEISPNKGDEQTAQDSFRHNYGSF